MITDINKIGIELDNQTKFSWNVDRDRVYTRDGEIGEDYDLIISDGQYKLTMTGNTERFTSLQDVINYINTDY